ncbi:MDR family oxidoreductase [Rosenbergiella collisarenosi]|uniref:MDR family oxidoreductase n=1 Tax=Rosenbergiella collisarenosi TaxID=1544695 RepID=UPI001F4E0CB3|nr:MDR family oxidoreductase [Rosenbergiella collisarenosi]
MAFKAIWLTDPQEGIPATLRDVDLPPLSHYPITLRVLYSSLNYKDALAISAKAPIVRQFPLIPGIDMVGEVIASEVEAWPVGKQVVVTGWGIGERHHGGLAEMFYAKEEWLEELPTTLSPSSAAAIGTAGLTAMLAVLELEQQGITPEQGPIIVSGASGGVGSFSTWILARLGFEVIAISGDPTSAEYLTDILGAHSVLPRSEFSAPAKKLLPEQWAGAIDCVGSHTLATILAGARRNACVVACGMAQGLDLTTSVAPFILRGIRLVGIDSVYCARRKRHQAWRRFASLLSEAPLPVSCQTITLQQTIEFADRLLTGEVRGRIIVKTAS